MAGKDRIKKRRQDFFERYTAFSRITNKDPFHVQKWVVGSSLDALTRLIDSFGPYDAQLNEKQDAPFLSAEQITALAEMYRHTLEDLIVLNRDEKNAVTENPRNAGERRRNGILRQEIGQNDRLIRILKKDLDALQRARGEIAENNAGLKLRDVYERSRIISDYTVKENSVQKTSSGNLSERIPLTLNRPGKPEQPGFFTVDKAADKLPHEHDILKEELKKYRGRMDFLNTELMDRFVDFIRQMDHGNNQPMLDKLIKSPEPEDFDDYEIFRLQLTGGFTHGKVRLYNEINTPAKLHMFTAILHKYLKAQNARLIYKNTGINPEGRVNRRNSAMSSMADFLGCPEILARAENVKLNIDGQILRGTFMEEAKGGDPRYLHKTPEFFATNLYSLENLKVKKQIATLQVLDYLCGNTDRHSGNIIYKFKKNEDGTVILDGIQGIDNDVSFGQIKTAKSNYMSLVLPKDMKVIPTDLAINILNLNEAKLRQVLYGFELTDKEMEAMGTRLKNLQNAITKGSIEYMKGYGKCHLLNNQIKMVDDDELDLIPFSDLCYISPDRKNGNAFAKVSAWTSNGSGNVRNMARNLADEYKDAVYRFTFGDCPESLKLIDDLSKDTVWHHGDSNDYNIMLRQMKALNEQMAGFSAPLMEDPLKGPHHEHVQELQRIRASIEQTLTQVKKYIRYKDSKESGEDWRTDQNRFSPYFTPGKTQRRYNHAIECREFLQRKLEEYDHLMEPLQKHNAFLQESAGLIKTYRDNKNLQEHQYYDSENHQDYITEQTLSHEKRVRFLLEEDMNRVLMADDPASLKDARIKRIINYGFGICSIYEQVKRDALNRELDNRIENLSDDQKKLVRSIKTADSETALKRSLALMMVIARIEVPKDPLKEADAMMKTAHFNFLFQEIQDELIPSSAELSPDIQLPDKEKITDYNLRLSAIISQNLAVPGEEKEEDPKGRQEDRKSDPAPDSMKASVSDSDIKSGSVISGSSNKGRISGASSKKNSGSSRGKSGPIKPHSRTK